MKFDAPWLFLSESVIYFLPLFISFFEDHNKEYPLKKVKQFSQCSFGEISSQRLTTSRYIWKLVSTINYKREKYYE